MPGNAFPAYDPHTGDPRAGRRANARLRLNVPATLILVKGTIRCLLDDLSRTGAAITPQGSLPCPGTSAVLRCQHIDVFANVVWTRFGRCGLHFDEKLPMDDVIALRRFADDIESYERNLSEQRTRDWVAGKSRIF